MPTYDDDMEQFRTAGSFNFSGKRIKDLGATEYTLGAIAVDSSGSVYSYSSELENCLSEIVEACRLNPRADNMMLRVTSFNSQLKEINGFKQLNQIGKDDFKGTIQPSGQTALYDATLEAIEGMLTYAKSMTDNDYAVNGILFVLTDGEENASIRSAKDVEKAFRDAVHGEVLESLQSILIGVGVDGNVKMFLNKFEKEVGFSQFVAVGEANKKSLANLAKFVSKSISAQSQALGTGGPSKAIDPLNVF